ncbi:GntR family transcriptional regulator [Leifsonia kafniensis]|uniref:GntR family transcriptional regulator n=1 Tax=Leifsonia kafniensis TaxID=475957 RepID=A0ABP7KPV8_9MICO
MSDLLGGRQVQRHAPIREQVAAIIRDAIVEMRLEAGQLLIERELCEMTSASRPSVREALRQLEAEGLVESLNGKGTVVSIASPELARDVYEVRAELEGLAAQLFAERADDELVAELRATVGDVVRASQGTEDSMHRDVLDAKNRVYEVLFRGAGNPVLHQMVNTLQRRVTQLRALTLSQPGRPQESVREIQAILAAVERRDAADARDAATLHVRRAAVTVLAALERQGTPSITHVPAR